VPSQKTAQARDTSAMESKMNTIFAAAALALALGAPAPAIAAPEQGRPYSCRLLDDAERQCAYNTIGRCATQSEVDRLRKECLRDGGRP
jgi:hypothetical protein